MNTLELLQPLLDEDAVLRVAEDGILSALPKTYEVQHYDGRAGIYDRVVGSRLYNRLAWGSSPEDYAGFARTAVASASGPLLDAGCGSLVFTAPAYLQTDRLLVLVDSSLDMLRRARARLAELNGWVPRNIVLLQANLFDLPLLPGAFSTVLSMGMLHLFEDPDGLLSELHRFCGEEGSIYFTSLVTDRAVGAHYLSLLHRAGEVAAPKSRWDLRALLRRHTAGDFTCRVRGNMMFATISGAVSESSEEGQLAETYVT